MKKNCKKILTKFFYNTPVFFAFLCSTILIALSYVQKLIAGFNPYLWKSYIVPSFYGLLVGFVLGKYIQKIKINSKNFQESEEKYSKILSTMKDEVYICSSTFVLEYINPAMIKRIGKNMLGEKCFKAIYNRNDKCPWCVIDEISKGEIIHYNFHNPIDNKYYYINNMPISNRDHSISKLTIARDITQQKVYESTLQKENEKLENALKKIKVLSGLLPICSNCKKIRDDKGYWNNLESYFEKHSDTSFSHSICPDCSKKLYGNEEWYADWCIDNKKESE